LICTQTCAASAAGAGKAGNRHNHHSNWRLQGLRHRVPAVATSTLQHQHVNPACNQGVGARQHAPSQSPIHSYTSSIGGSSICSSSQKPHCVQPHMLGLACMVALPFLLPEASSALEIEPANALSLPTWAIHVSSVVEWVTAMGLMWRYAEVSGNSRWKGMTWGMMPALGSALCACTWHLFYNSPDLEFLVVLQAFLTVVGNATCAMAAYRIWDGRETSQPSS